MEYELIEDKEELREFNRECDEKIVEFYNDRDLLKAFKTFNKNSDAFAFADINPNWSKLSAKEKNEILGEKFFDEKEEARKKKAKAIAIAMSKRKKYLSVDI